MLGYIFLVWLTTLLNLWSFQLVYFFWIYVFIFEFRLKLLAQWSGYLLIDDVWAGMNITRSQKKWLWQYLQKGYQQKMLLWILVNKLYVF